MLVRLLSLMQKPVRMAACACLLWVGSFAGFSDEPAQPAKVEKEETSTTAPVKKSLFEFRAYRPPESPFGFEKINVPTPPVQTPPNQRIGRQNQEALDRQRNWIFVLPGDEKNSGNAENIFNLDDGKSKSVLTRFLENKPATGSTLSPSINASGFNPNANGFNQHEYKNVGFPQMSGLGSEKPKGLNAWDQPVMHSQNSLGDGGAMLSLGERWRELRIPRSQKTPEEKQAEMKVFESLFVPQNNGANNGGLTPLGNNFGAPMVAPESRDMNAFKVTPAHLIYEVHNL